MKRISGSTQDPRSLSLFLIMLIFLAAVAVFLGACSVEVKDTNGNGNGPDSSTVASDSTRADAESGGFFARFRRDEEEKTEEAQVPVELVAVGLSDVPSFLSATASLEPEKRVTVQCESSGRIQELRVEEGDWVETGQLMASLDGETESLALAEATLRAGAREREYRRGESLYAEQGMSSKEFQDLRFRYEEAEAQRKSAEHRLGQTRILAPFSGRVSRRHVDPGQHVTVGVQLFELVDNDPLLARIFLPEKQAMRITPGQPVLILPDTSPDLELPGEILRVAPVVDTRTGTVKVTCRISRESEYLRPGSFVRVKVQTDLHQQVLVVPKRALVPEGGETYVFKALADSVIKVAIETGYGAGGQVEVTGGLEAGDRIVTVGTGSLKNGSKIKDLGAAGADSADASSGDGDES
jgi:membrane fusion protein, multidrug efflux system